MDTAVRELAVPEFDRINVTIEGNGKILLDWKKYSQGISLVLSVFSLCIIFILGIVMFFGVSIIFGLLQNLELFKRYDTEIFGLMIGICLLVLMYYFVKLIQVPLLFRKFHWMEISNETIKVPTLNGNSKYSINDDLPIKYDYSEIEDDNSVQDEFDNFARTVAKWFVLYFIQIGYDDDEDNLFLMIATKNDGPKFVSFLQNLLQVEIPRDEIFSEDVVDEY